MIDFPPEQAKQWEILVQKQGAELVLSALKNQIQSDFLRIGKNGPDLPIDSFQNWQLEIGEFIGRLTSEELSKILYIIDIPENWNANMQVSGHYFSDLAQAIIYRELTKIYYRITFSL